MNTNYLRPQQAANLLGVDVHTIRRWALAGKLKPIYTVGGHARYHADEVKQLRSRLVIEERLRQAREQ